MHCGGAALHNLRAAGTHLLGWMPFCFIISRFPSKINAISAFIRHRAFFPPKSAQNKVPQRVVNGEKKMVACDAATAAAAKATRGERWWTGPSEAAPGPSLSCAASSSSATRPFDPAPLLMAAAAAQPRAEGRAQGRHKGAAPLLSRGG